MAESLAKPTVNPLTVAYAGAAGLPFTINVIGLQLQVQSEIEDVTSGTDAARRVAKTGLVQGRLLVTGFELLGVVNEETTQGDNITIGYGDGSRTKVLVGVLESMEMNANKTKPYVGVAVSFRLSGAQNDTVTP
jgi:hypothetical protein